MKTRDPEKKSSEASAPPSEEDRRSGLDRRSGQDRRQKYSIDYFETDGEERRLRNGERRQRDETRRDWVRITEWSSAGDPDGTEPLPPE